MSLRLTSISNRLYSIAVLCTIGIVAVVGVLALRSSLYDNKTAELHRLVEMATSLAQAAHDKAAKGQLSEQEAKAAAAAGIGQLRFDSDNYVFVQDFQSMLIVHPVPKLVGTDSSQLKDPNGRFFAREMTDLARKAGGGIVDYHWPRPGAEQSVAKRAYIAAFASPRLPPT